MLLFCENGNVNQLRIIWSIYNNNLSFYDVKSFWRTLTLLCHCFLYQFRFRIDDITMNERLRVWNANISNTYKESCNDRTVFNDASCALNLNINIYSFWVTRWVFYKKRELFTLREFLDLTPSSNCSSLLRFFVLFVFVLHFVCNIDSWIVISSMPLDFSLTFI